MTRLTSFVRLVASAALLAPATLSAQENERARVSEDGPRVRKVIAIGDVPRVNGLRLNYRDRDLELVNGINVTIWTPHDDSFEGSVRGLALGVPMTGGGDITGLSVALFGVGVSRDLRGATFAGIGGGAGDDVTGISVAGIGFGAGGDVGGITVGGIGVGAGGSSRGITIGGVGAAAGGDMRGLVAGGIGAAAGGNARGLLVGGIGAGVGGSVRGAVVGGIGVGAGGSVRGLAVGGIGVGAGGSIRGLTVAGVGAGAGGDVSGITIAGIGVGAGGTVRGLTIAGVGVGAPELRNVVIAPLVGTEHSRALVVAPILFRTETGADIRGVNISAVNAVRGSQGGLAIGIVNYAEELDGVQLGLVNIVKRNPVGRRVLPIINFGRGAR